MKLSSNIPYSERSVRLKRKLTSMMNMKELVTRHEAAEIEIQNLVDTLRGVGASSQDQQARPMWQSLCLLAELCKQDRLVDTILEHGAVEALLPLIVPRNEPFKSPELQQSWSTEENQEKACTILGMLALKPESQKLIADSGAFPGLIWLLHKHTPATLNKTKPDQGRAAEAITCKAAEAITSLAHENVANKNLVREEQGIPPLVALLGAWDPHVQKAAAAALRTLAFKNEDNKQEIVACGALPQLIQMLSSSDVAVHYEAIGVIGNLVHSTDEIKLKVLESGALQPTIALLSSHCSETQREAALLLGQFARTDITNIKARIVQRGAVPPLIHMLRAPDISVREMAAFALGRLAQGADNQAGLVQAGALPPLLELLESRHLNLQHNAAFALYGLAENEDNIAPMVRVNMLPRLDECREALQRLVDMGNMPHASASKDCVMKTAARIKERLCFSRVSRALAYMLRSQDSLVRRHAALPLALAAADPSCSPEQVCSILKDGCVTDVLLDILSERELDARALGDTITAVHALARRLTELSTPGTVPTQERVFLGEQFVNNQMLADVTFVIEGRPFYAHRIALLASSDVFRAMFESGFTEADASSISLPEMKYSAFESMMKYVYTGHVEVALEEAEELLKTADQYMMDGMKVLCVLAIAQGLVAGHLDMQVVESAYRLAEESCAPQLAQRCVMLALDRHKEFMGVNNEGKAGLVDLMLLMQPTLREMLTTALSRLAAGAANLGATSAPEDQPRAHTPTLHMLSRGRDAREVRDARTNTAASGAGGGQGVVPRPW